LMVLTLCAIIICVGADRKQTGPAQTTTVDSKAIKNYT
jgi:hypothetical protein